ncbi:hypothetical protein [Spiroplasma ixodetis]|nr:hypothetical protein [Spiroplasma ixodetis]
MCRFLKLSKSTYYFNLKKKEKFKIIFMMKLLLVLLKKIKKFMVLED